MNAGPDDNSPDGTEFARAPVPRARVAAGRFTLVQSLGRGGMGEVWLAQDERLHEPVALKFLPPEVRADPVALDDLRRETARSHRLTHPNIVRIHDLHEEQGGMAFIAMEYVDGPTLAGLLLEQSDRVLSWEFLRPLVQQLCGALDYAHGEKVIHRDLKPANVMVDGKGRLKLADFGIAATVSDSVSRVSGRHATSGTLPYMSPQQLAGKHPQVADDIYALGVTLYELLTSKPPFYTGDITHQALREAPEAPDDRLAALGIASAVPPDVATLIMACLAKEPAQRPQSARAAAEWVGLEVVSKPSVESLAEAMFPQSGPNRLEAGVDSSEPQAPPLAVGGRKMALVAGAVVAALLLGGAALWHYGKLRAGGGEVRQPATRAASSAPPDLQQPMAAAQARSLVPAEPSSPGTLAPADVATNSPVALDPKLASRLVWIPPGMFTMGSPPLEKRREADEGPQTRVTLTRGFWMGRYLVTQGDYQSVMGYNPSHFTGDWNRPVERVSWFDATNYCGKLTEQHKTARRILMNYAYRLPTEAEWEYACRAGTTTRFSYGDDPTYEHLTYYAWYSGNSGGLPHDSTNPDEEEKASGAANSGGHTQGMGQKAPNP
jgi:formylglycine-generating enzyme required for sulfatase activity